ncbi:hypothetical protein OOK58_42650 [Streptomyces sp. NBC_01728]|uniref:hypothetical protein n=1 Tax=unclassified Streptomyces TaxID=2593676 RepID=UPI00224D3DF1|nr:MULTISPECIES: hypothetical protein [unclassified Streptomyces]MCX4458611.1 hypothetical protein [Streptomyces sp. NBC_01719]MCX4497968.1 hypothetical protein [Streptomyces sp. NBC_01728]
MALAVATRVVDLAELGQRWHDQCRDCMIAGIRLNWAAGRPMEGRYRVTLWTGDQDDGVHHAMLGIARLHNLALAG